MNSLFRIWQSAVCEWCGALRSRRALVLLCLYLLAGAGCMYGTISILGKMEEELAQVLQLPESEHTGVVSATLWRSRPFKRMVRSAVHDEQIYRAIEGRHPAELIYAWFAFLCAPFLVVLVAGNRVADDLGSGAVRYSITRCTRAEWSLGKYVGQALMIALALLAEAVAAWLVATVRLSGTDILPLLPAMLGWGLRVWVYSLAWLGVALGISHVTRSGSRATAFGFFAVTGLLLLPAMLRLNGNWFDLPWLENFDALSPSPLTDLLWRAGATPTLVALGHSLAIGFAFLALGYADFGRRDA